MKFVEHNGNFQIAPDDVKSYDTLPAGYYKINYDASHDLYSLDRTYEFTLHEPKIYGVQVEKMNKVAKAFETSDRSLGVLLTGDKGIGKSLFAKLTCMTMFAKGYPVIIVDKSYKGLERFLSDIPGNIVMFFDEFDKIFHIQDSSEGREEATQQSLLTLFDGTSQQKRLFIITANNADDLDQCMINRPGRFHYHFNFSYPTANDIAEYMKDNMNKYDQSEVDNVIKLSNFTDINYDTLRSIVFECNLGYKVKDFIDDLNIKANYQRYMFLIKDMEGKVLTCNSSLDNDNFTLKAGITHYLARGSYSYANIAKIKLFKDPVILGSYMILKAESYEITWFGDGATSFNNLSDIEVRVASKNFVIPISSYLE